MDKKGSEGISQETARDLRWQLLQVSNTLNIPMKESADTLYILRTQLPQIKAVIVQAEKELKGDG